MALGRIQRLDQVFDETHLLGQALDQQTVGIRVGDHTNVRRGHLLRGQAHALPGVLDQLLVQRRGQHARRLLD
ncbi:hypothetical protein D9M71_770730 [compost metagenome]